MYLQNLKKNKRSTDSLRTEHLQKPRACCQGHQCHIWMKFLPPWKGNKARHISKLLLQASESRLVMNIDEEYLQFPRLVRQMIRRHGKQSGCLLPKWCSMRVSEGGAQLPRFYWSFWRQIHGSVGRAKNGEAAVVTSKNPECAVTYRRDGGSHYSLSVNFVTIFSISRSSGP